MDKNKPVLTVKMIHSGYWKLSSGSGGGGGGGVRVGGGGGGCLPILLTLLCHILYHYMAGATFSKIARSHWLLCGLESYLGQRSIRFARTGK